MFGNVYKDKVVLLTGHTGFKGSWLALWLKELGAKVVGYSLNLPSTPNHFELLALDIVSITGDIRDRGKLAETFNKYRPEIVFHLAAQPLVRYSYKDPVFTFETNIMGTVNVFETCRQTESIRAIVNITSDKCYENREWVWGYRENDPMGGYDPYSASKGCAELVTNSYRNSFFNLKDHGKSHHILLASARAGNVIGGGDWGEDRLIPDIVKAASKNESVLIRSPQATRPWQHVLEPLSGYLLLGQKLLEGKKEFAEGWNFGPNDERSLTVQEVLESIKQDWHKIAYFIQQQTGQMHETNLLRLDCSRAHIDLKWGSVWNASRTFEKTVNWYKKYYEENAIDSRDDLASYLSDARSKQSEWTKA
ncbi:MAG: CDP-glucose 4,6-dehydratase [Firmicutes bacterium]|jgi:CDP-glucose 4,6-dehydratase|nr:CDP-glucose 4,6-dehydratase [Dethiobacter sp.]MCL4462309.1 CDP-glucose 4,6-dehydratase [Bacillota bacterium]MCL5993929.1 CDP-glucose 4,6-dehydratase [Bacillota bacterium]